MKDASLDSACDRSSPLSAERGESRCIGGMVEYWSRPFSAVLLAATLSLAPSIAAFGSEDSKRKSGDGAGADAREVVTSTWSYPSYPEARAAVAEALKDLALPPGQMEEAMKGWPDSEMGPPPSAWLDALAETFHVALPDLREVINQARDSRQGLAMPDFQPLVDASGPAFVKRHLRLLAGRWLAQHQYYDEALEMMVGLEPQTLIDPATLLFHSAAAHHQLLHQEDCLKTVAKLLENEAQLPARYRSLAQLMQADIQPLKADTLDETSRLMESVERRLGLARAGKRVREEEEAVVAKLDKLIEELEKQREEQQKQQQAAASGNQTPSRPMQDSQAAGGKGPGNVDPKKLQALGAWGNIPPKQRQEALQQLSRDLPAHYREVVEEYFRKLASDEKAPK